MRPATLARYRSLLALEQLPGEPTTPAVAVLLLASLDDAERSLLRRRPPTRSEASIHLRLRAAVLVQLAVHHPDYGPAGDAAILMWRCLATPTADALYGRRDARRAAALRAEAEEAAGAPGWPSAEDEDEEPAEDAQG